MDLEVVAFPAIHREANNLGSARSPDHGHAKDQLVTEAGQRKIQPPRIIGRQHWLLSSLAFRQLHPTHRIGLQELQLDGLDKHRTEQRLGSLKTFGKAKTPLIRQLPVST